MQLIGIENENEFYPAGFFSGALEEELSQVIARWSEGAGITENPATRLAANAAEYKATMSRARTMSDRIRASEIRSGALHGLVSALGYTYQRSGLRIAREGDPLVPSVARVADANGRDVLWVLEAPMPDREDLNTDPLGMSFRPEQFAADEVAYAETSESVEELLGRGIFSLKHSPRYVLLVGLSQVVLIDRNKWQARSVLRFDLAEIFERRERDTINAMACFISREARAPESGVPLADRLEEEAQRHANAVTTSLKSTVRDAIELLGQEVLDITGGKYPTGPSKDTWIDGKELSLESLRFMYRLLFLFYAEANPRLGVLDLKDSVYATGYSLEALRELESVRLRTKEEREGTYLWDSLKTLLDLMYTGNDQVFRLPAVKVSLLDPESTPILSGVRLRNETIQKVIRLLSLKRARSGTSRISYAQLGIGQLGAVYETLISFTGFVAKTDLIELKPKSGRGAQDGDDDGAEQQSEEGLADDEGDDDELSEDEDIASRSDKIDLLAPSYFVPKARAAEFQPDEVVYAGTEPKVYRKGTFVYRLAGRDREKSASYYTPEPLARLLVKNALMERCKGMPADEILNLKVLEPAMGSAAFLVETTNQLADLYLERKQQEVGETIPQEQYFLERQKVRAFIADRNCFGVDLNPIAVELGAISLWLNSLHDSDFSPWFGDQLHAGNSLIGARRASYDPALLKAKKRDGLWFNQKPDEHGWKQGLPTGHIWQFLLPAKDMAKFDTDKSIAEFAGDAQSQIKEWRKGGFFHAMEPHEVKLLQKLSEVAEELFSVVARDLAKSRAEANDEITLWPDRVMLGVQGRDFRDKERRRRQLLGEDHASNTLPYKRLKTAMDAWCALWLWPLDQTHLLPSRAEFLHGMAMILEGGFTPEGMLAVPSMLEFSDPAPDFFSALEPNQPARDLFAAAVARQQNLFRETDVDSLVEEVEWLRVAVEVAARERFTHFDLIFADVLSSRGGFDVVVGNPPWAQPSWNEGDAIAEIDPAIVVKNLTAVEIKQQRQSILRSNDIIARFVNSYTSARGAINATGSGAFNPLVGAGSNNLYRCFLDAAFRVVSVSGTVAMIHQDGHLTDPNSGQLRALCYSRLVKRFHMRNQIKRKNFAEVDNNRTFSINIYRGYEGEVSFLNFSGGFLASQIEESLHHDGTGLVPLIKGEDGNWDTRGHRDRIVTIDITALSAIHKLIEDADTPIEQTRLIQPYSTHMLKAFEAFADNESLSSLRLSWQIRGVWVEGNSEKTKDYITRQGGFPEAAADTILSGPNIYVSHPLYKSPSLRCRSNKDYELIDLDLIGEEYVPSTNYKSIVDQSAYLGAIPRCEWNPSQSHIDAYRVAVRKMVSLGGERSLIAAIIPPGVAHIDGIQSVNFQQEEDALRAGALWASIPFDYLVKVTGRQNLHEDDLGGMPFFDPGDTAIYRILQLVCLTRDYSVLWEKHAGILKPAPWHSSDARLESRIGAMTWTRDVALRSDFARRMALVEIDVLVSQALGLSLSQLIELYKIYFPVLRQYEASTWYDLSGDIAWTSSRGLIGAGYIENGKSPSRKRWDKIIESGITELECDVVTDFLPGGPRTTKRLFHGPFHTCDRVEDYKRAWAYFEAKKVEGIAA